MSFTIRCLAAAVLAVTTTACGDDGSVTTIDGPGGPDARPRLRIVGEAQTVQATELTGLAGATIEAFAADDGLLATTSSATDGGFELTVATGGDALDVYLKGTSPGHLPGYFYLSRPLVADDLGARVFVFEQWVVDFLHSNVLVTQDPSKALVVVAVQTSVGTLVAGATVTVSPAGSARVFYNAGPTPSPTATITDASGIAYIVNAEAGTVTVDAAMGAIEFHEHAITARTGAVTVTVVEP